MALLLLLGLFANLTVIGSVEPLGMVPLSSWIALSASNRWSNRMKPTPFDRPEWETSTFSHNHTHFLLNAACLISAPAGGLWHERPSKKRSIFFLVMSIMRKNKACIRKQPFGTCLVWKKSTKSLCYHLLTHFFLTCYVCYVFMNEMCV